LSIHIGTVTHPIAGFDDEKVKEILDIPEDATVITLVIISNHSETISPTLSDKQAKVEKMRPERLTFEKFVYLNSFGEKT
jgi:hypothetical protein